MKRGGVGLLVQRQGQRTAVGAPKRHLLFRNCEKRRKKIEETGTETHTQRPPVRAEPRRAQRTSGEGRAGFSAGGGAWGWWAGPDPMGVTRPCPSAGRVPPPRVLRAADVTIAAARGAGPAAAARGWFELVRCHGNAAGAYK